MSNLIENEAQELADKFGFDLKKIPYGYQFRIGKIILNYYETTGTVVTCVPKQAQKVKRNIQVSQIGKMLKKLKGDLITDDTMTGEQAISLVLAGIKIKHKRLGEPDWRKADIKKLTLDSFLNKTFVFELEN